MDFIWKLPHASVRLLIMVSGSLIVWVVMSIAMRFFIIGLQNANLNVIIPSLVSFGLQLIIAMLLIVFGNKYSSKGEGHVRLNIYVLSSLFAFLSGFVIVFLKQVDDAADGLFLAFPISFITSLSSLALTYKDTLPSTIITAMIGGSISTSLFSLLFNLFLPIFAFFFNKDLNFNNPSFLALSFGDDVLTTSIILAWFFSLLLINLPIFLILRFLAKQEKSQFKKINYFTISKNIQFSDDDEDAQDSSVNISSRRLLLEKSATEESPLLI